MSNFYIERMKELNADGIDFMPLFSEKVIATYTKDTIKNASAFPKTNYKFWKNTNGRKVYF